MRYFSYLSPLQEEGIFYKKTNVITKHSPKSMLDYALGGILYMPATRGNIAEMILTKKHPQLGSMVICLEDAIGDIEVENAEISVVKCVKEIFDAVNTNQISVEDLPLMFVRVRSPEQLKKIADNMGDSIQVLTGIVFPKFSIDNAENYMQNLQQITQKFDVTLYGMPILETPDLLDLETRALVLLKLKTIFHEYQDLIVNIRIGATDLCGLYGIRRNYYTTIYDISLIRSLISEIVTCFGREFVISGPVWEYFDSSSSRILKPELRQSPFSEHGKKGLDIRSELLNDYVDGLIKETLLDLANGINGKTVIHPSHLKIVQSLNTISKEEYLDARSIVDHSDGDVGVMKSLFSNKMNEVKPHLKWAKKILLKSEIYGVYHENSSYIDLLTTQEHIKNNG